MNKFKVIIAGGREFGDYQLLKKHCDWLLKMVIVDRGPENIEIVCGEARGADKLGRKYAEELGYHIKSFPAEWYPDGKLDKRAGILRNIEMGDYADAAIVFWDGESKGSKQMIEYMKKLGKPIRVIKYKEGVFSGYNS